VVQTFIPIVDCSVSIPCCAQAAPRIYGDVFEVGGLLTRSPHSTHRNKIEIERSFSLHAVAFGTVAFRHACDSYLVNILTSRLR
jgi:hypothetical protein